MNKVQNEILQATKPVLGGGYFIWVAHNGEGITYIGTYQVDAQHLGRKLGWLKADGGNLPGMSKDVDLGMSVFCRPLKEIAPSFAGLKGDLLAWFGPDAVRAMDGSAVMELRLSES